MVILGSVGCASPSPTATDEAATGAESSADEISEAAATVVIEGTYDGSITFCQQRGELTIRMLRRGTHVRGEFSGQAPAVASENGCDAEEIAGYWDIEATDPNDLDVLACVVNGIAAQSSIVFQRDTGIEVECTREGAQGGMLIETTFYVDL
jgi:hypothetical protein